MPTQIFVYEHVVGGGGWFEPGLLDRDSSFLREGSAMLLAVAADLTALLSTHVMTLCDERLALDWPAHVRRASVASREQHDEQFAACASAADWTLLIAPECGGVLADLAERVSALGGRLAGPSPALVRLASDKHATCEWLSSRGVPTPHGRLLAPGQPLPDDIGYPAVLKPTDGAGSSDVRRIDAWNAVLHAPLNGSGWRVERHVPGLAASCAVLCGPGGRVALPACQQRLSDDGEFHYRGGSAPLPNNLDERARHLALRAAAALDEPLRSVDLDRFIGTRGDSGIYGDSGTRGDSGLRGYIGFDLVLGDFDDGRDDYVIEVNPRLTTSYIGLRRLCGVNLAGAMLSVASGAACELWFHDASVEFDADGRVTVVRANER